MRASNQEPIPAGQWRDITYASVRWPNCGHPVEFDADGYLQLCPCYDNLDLDIGAAFGDVFDSIGMVNPFNA